jgi:hypothetical protein
LSNGKSQHFRWADIASLAARNDRFSRRAQLTACDGSLVNLKWSTTAHSEGELWPVISYFLGERFTVENPPR